MKNWAVCLAIALSLSLPHGTAWAQTDQERATARSAAKAGIEAFQEGDSAQAVELLTRAESVIHAPTHLLYIARAQVKLGHLVQAKEAYLKIKHESLSGDAPKAFTEAQQAAQVELADLETRIPSVIIDVEGVDRSLVQLTVDDERLPNIALGVATPLNPGKRRIAVTAPGKGIEKTTIDLEEGTQKRVVLRLSPVPEKEPSPTSPETAPHAESGDQREEPLTPSPRKSSRSPRKFWGFGLGAAGVAALGVGGTFGVLTLVNASKAQNDEDLCPEKNCTPAGDERIQTARVQAMVSNVTLGIGAVLVGVGAYLVLSSPRSEKEIGRLGLNLRGQHPVLSLEGAF